MSIPPKIDESTCVSCGACIAVCPKGVLEMVDDKAKVVHAERCDACGECVTICPVQAITRKK